MRKTTTCPTELAGQCYTSFLLTDMVLSVQDSGTLVEHLITDIDISLAKFMIVRLAWIRDNG